MDEHRQRQLSRINELSALARNSWLVLLAYLAYIGITLLAVEDADFFVPTQKTELPLVGIAIPTASFFVFAPPLGAALYIYLHIHLLKLFDALATAPAHIEGEELGDLIHPWLANDLLLTMRADDSVSDRPLRRLSNLASRLLVWVAGPLVMAGFWWQSMPAHDEWLTLLLAFSLIVTCYAGFSSWWSARSASKRQFRRPWPKPWRSRLSRSVGVIAVIGIFSVSWLRTEGGFDHYYVAFIELVEAAVEDPDWFEEHTYPKIADIKGPWLRERPLFSAKISEVQSIRALVSDRFGLAQTDLDGIQLVKLPEHWRSPEDARLSYRERWCHREGLSMSVCGPYSSDDSPTPVALLAERKKWCGQYAEFDDGDCLLHFISLNLRFKKDWEEERSITLANLPSLDLEGRDLRNAQATFASLVNAQLDYARFDGSDLSFSQMESASLEYARLVGATLIRANIERSSLYKADLRAAWMESASLRGSILREADLRGAQLGTADLVDADFFRAKLNGASFFDADLREASLIFSILEDAGLHGANLRNANLKGANLKDAHLNNSNLEGTDLDWTVLSGADLTEVRNLTQAQLEYAVGDEHTILPKGVATDTGKPFYVWSCWNQEPDPFDTDFFIPTPHRETFEKYYCSGQLRKRTGTLVQKKH